MAPYNSFHCLAFRSWQAYNGVIYSRTHWNANNLGYHFWGRRGSRFKLIVLHDQMGVDSVLCILMLGRTSSLVIQNTA
jgi:hypothetical protein